MNQLETYKSIRKSACPSPKIFKDKSRCAKSIRRQWNQKNNKGEQE